MQLSFYKQINLGIRIEFCIYWNWVCISDIWEKREYYAGEKSRQGSNME